MFSRFTKGIAVASLALATTVATPTWAETRNNTAVGDAILGLTFLAIVGTALANQNNRHETPTVTVPARRTDGIPTPDWSRDRNNGRGWGGGQGGRDLASRLPDRCERPAYVHGDQRMVYGSRCLQNNYIDVDRLPSNCEVRFETNHGRRTGYDAICLANSNRFRDH